MTATETAAAAALAALGAWLLVHATTRPAQQLASEGDQLPDAPGADTVANEWSDQLPSFGETLVLAVTDPWATFGNASAGTGDQAANVRAFLDLIAFSEGTAAYPGGGYSTMFGGRQCDSLADHPRQFFAFTDKAGRQLQTSAAGRYQFLSRTWDVLRAKLGLPDFGPDSQDAACVELIRERGALDDVKAGRVSAAVAKCAKTWASLPGAGYAQPERKLSQLLAAYTDAGGTLSA